MTKGSERRVHERSDCDIAAKIELADGLVMACRLKDLSTSGFKLQIADAVHLPDEFDLLIPVVEGVDQRCRVKLVWRDGDMVGGVFLTPLGQ
jgi:hypothetical protein